MMRLFAITERELRKFFHSPLLLAVALMGPLLQLLLLGNAIGGKMTGVPIGFVDYDRGSQSLKVQEALQAISANAKTFHTEGFDTEFDAHQAVLSGRVKAAIIIPPHFTQNYYKKAAPKMGIVVDNTDTFTSDTLQQKMNEIVTSLNFSSMTNRLSQSISLDTIESYPYVRYIEFLLPGIMSLAIFLSVMFGGGMLYTEDRLRGVHEGFLVTPITSLEMVGGMVAAGTVKASICGMLVAMIGSPLVGLNLFAHPLSLMLLLLTTIAAGFSLNSLMFLLMGRIEDPMIPKVLSGLLNTLLFFPSGAIYPIAAFPAWLRALSTINPMTYAVEGFRALMLKHASVSVISGNVLVLVLIGIFGLLCAAKTFKRTL